MVAFCVLQATSHTALEVFAPSVVDVLGLFIFLCRINHWVEK